MEDAEIPLAQLRLLKLRTTRNVGNLNMKKVDEVYEDMGGRAGLGGGGLDPAPPAGPPTKATAVEPSIRFDAVLQYSAEESDLMVATVMNISDSFLLGRSAEAREIQEDPVSSARGSNLELDQREQLADLSAWRLMLMSAVLPE